MSEAGEEDHIENQRSQCLRWENLICRIGAWPRDFTFQPRSPPAAYDASSLSGHPVPCQGFSGGALIDDTQVIHILFKVNLCFQSMFPS
jgi:hypothetical protein